MAERLPGYRLRATGCSCGEEPFPLARTNAALLRTNEALAAVICFTHSRELVIHTRDCIIREYEPSAPPSIIGPVRERECRIHHRDCSVPAHEATDPSSITCALSNR